ncbi:RNA binding protein, cold-inducible rrm [Legionella beliardensis]|uniref:RNA binding protein, cold-inducible rrm n=1 Tax=Legionella beliardensis TaxID=91822 RepID=A0A378JY74_9GAMM|nr:RNA-binding protein [Legionella beliardensis]STX55712.1 RNA binding protein, cold-inducible rrm [Legionella beliardensis]
MSQYTIYIANLPFSTTENEIETEFCKFGKIVELYLIKDRFTGYCRGMGLITFSSQKEATNSLEMHGQQWYGRTLKVTEVQNRAALQK